jgi:hypothetical protein
MRLALDLSMDIPTVGTPPGRPDRPGLEMARHGHSRGKDKSTCKTCNHWYSASASLAPPPHPRQHSRTKFLVLSCGTRAPRTVVLAWWSWPPPMLELIDRLVVVNPASSTGCCEWGHKTTDENHALTPVLAGNGSVFGAVTLLKASPMQSSIAHSCCSEEKPRSGYPKRPYLLSTLCTPRYTTNYCYLLVINPGRMCHRKSSLSLQLLNTCIAGCPVLNLFKNLCLTSANESQSLHSDRRRRILRNPNLPAPGDDPSKTIGKYPVAALYLC